MNDSANFATFTSSSNSSTRFIWMLQSNVDFVVFGIYVLFGLPTHSYVIWLITRGTGSGIASEFFNLNLSLCEMIYSLSCVVYGLSSFFQSLYLFSLFCVGLGITGRPLFQSLICVERYLAVVHPVIFLKFKPLRYKALCCTVAWILTLGACLLCRFLLNSAVFLDVTWLLSMQFIFLFSIQLFCCLAVLRVLKKSGPGERGREREEENHMKKRALYLILISTVTMFIMFVPYIITGILAYLKHNLSVTWSVSFFCLIMPSFVHPFLFLRRNGKLKLCFSK